MASSVAGSSQACTTRAISRSCTGIEAVTCITCSGSPFSPVTMVGSMLEMSRLKRPGMSTARERSLRWPGPPFCATAPEVRLSTTGRVFSGMGSGSDCRVAVRRSLS
ncbi:hypothetical protein D9M68_531950 [compost metagenome]